MRLTETNSSHDNDQRAASLRAKPGKTLTFSEVNRHAANAGETLRRAAALYPGL